MAAFWRHRADNCPGPRWDPTARDDERDGDWERLYADPTPTEAGDELFDLLWI